MKKTTTLILTLTLAFALAAGNLSTLAFCPVVALSEETEGGENQTKAELPEPANPPTEAPTSPPTNPPTEPTNGLPANPTSEPTNPPTNPPANPSTVPPMTASAEATPGIPELTKHPTSETVDEGGNAEFVARASYSRRTVWYLVDPDNSGHRLLLKEASMKFPGLTFDGENTEHLYLHHIPKDLSGWNVVAEFVGSNGLVRSSAAVITVVASPTVDVKKRNDNGRTALYVDAQAPRGTTLAYEWFSSDAPSGVNEKPVSNATGQSYTVPEPISDTIYFRCKVWCRNEEKESPFVYTNYIEVTPAVLPTEPPITEPPATELATEPPSTEPETTSLSTEPLQQEIRPPVVSNSPTRSNTLLLRTMGAVAAIVLLGAVSVALILKFYHGKNNL